MPRRILAGFPQNARNELVRLRRGSPGHDSGPLGWLLFRCRTAPGQHLLPIWRKLGTRKSRLETKTENEAFSALLARLWCHLILENPANRAENLICLCSATIGQTGWRMAQSGAIRSRLETSEHRSEPASCPIRGVFRVFRADRFARAVSSRKYMESASASRV